MIDTSNTTLCGKIWVSTSIMITMSPKTASVHRFLKDLLVLSNSCWRANTVRERWITLTLASTSVSTLFAKIVPMAKVNVLSAMCRLLIFPLALKINLNKMFIWHLTRLVSSSKWNLVARCAQKPLRLLHLHPSSFKESLKRLMCCCTRQINFPQATRQRR